MGAMSWMRGLFVLALGGSTAVCCRGLKGQLCGQSTILPRLRKRPLLTIPSEDQMHSDSLLGPLVRSGCPKGL